MSRCSQLFFECEDLSTVMKNSVFLCCSRESLLSTRPCPDNAPRTHVHRQNSCVQLNLAVPVQYDPRSTLSLTRGLQSTAHHMNPRIEGRVADCVVSRRVPPECHPWTMVHGGATEPLTRVCHTNFDDAAAGLTITYGRTSYGTISRF